jgi:hypothetical protein
MKRMPYMLTSNPPQDEYRCECGYTETVRLGEHNNATIWGFDWDNRLDFAKEYDVVWIGSIDLSNTEDKTVILKQNNK